MRRLKPVQSHPSSNEVFAACVALHTAGELVAEYPGHSVHVRPTGDGDGFALIVDGAVACEGGSFEVAAMFVTVCSPLVSRNRIPSRVGSPRAATHSARPTRDLPFVIMLV